MKMKFCKTHMDTAELWSKLSYAKKAQVGSVLVDETNTRVLCCSFNGTLPGFSNICESEVIDKDGVVTLKTLPSVVHAEENIICFAARSGIKTQNCILYTTLSPCVQCAKLIINSGIKHIFYKDEYRDKSGIDLLKQAGVEVIQTDKYF